MRGTKLAAGAWLCGAAAYAATVGWRGDGTGSFPDATPPVAWGPEARIAWRVPIQGWSNASPIHHDGRIVVCAEPATVLCLALEDGRLLWTATQDYADVAATPAEAEKAKRARARLIELEPRLRAAERAARRAADELRKTPEDAAAKQRLAEAETQRAALRAEAADYLEYRFPDRHDVTGLTSPTPVADARHVYVLFGSGTLAAYTWEGQRVWGRVVGRPKHGWGHSASPRLAGDTLIVNIGDQLLGLDAATGALRWETGSASGWGTPAVAQVGGRWIVLTTAGGWFDAADGRRLAERVQSFPWNGPVVVDNVVYQMDEQGASAYAIEPDGTPRQLWRAPLPKDRYYASPVLHAGLLYNLTQKGELSVLRAADGSLAYQQTIDFGRGGRTVYPSPFQAGGHIYVSADNGTTVVLAPGPEYREVSRNQLSAFRSTPLSVGRRLLVRTLQDLTCLE